MIMYTKYIKEHADQNSPSTDKWPWRDDAFQRSLQSRLLQKVFIHTFSKVNDALLKNGILTLSSFIQVL